MNYTAFMQPLKNELDHLPAQRWVDLGCGGGVFTVALSNILPRGSTIIAVDKNAQELPQISGNHVSVKFIQADFETNLPQMYPLDGIMMANSLHYVRHKEKFIEKLLPLFEKNKNFIVVEYDTDKPIDPWVPFPVNFEQLTKLFHSFNYNSIDKIGTVNSLYGGKMYLARITQK